MNKIELPFGVEIEITSINDKINTIMKNSMAKEGEQLRLLR